MTTLFRKTQPINQYLKRPEDTLAKMTISNGIEIVEMTEEKEHAVAALKLFNDKARKLQV